MNKTLLLVAAFLLLGAGAWYAFDYQKKNKAGTMVSWDMDFAVREPEKIGKIFIADRNGATATLVRKEGYWEYNGKFKARESAMEILLETVSRMVVKSVPTEAAAKEAVKVLAAQGMKVELYDPKDKQLKVFYVGGITPDERGTYMMMQGAENPYIVHLPGFTGQLRVRFFTGDDNWRDKTVFAEKPESITKVEVEYPQQKSLSFKLEKTGSAEYVVSPYFSTTPKAKGPQRKGVAEGYILKFEKIMAEAFETANPLRDSVTALVPFAIVRVENKDHRITQAKFWPVDVERHPTTGVVFVNRYFTDLNEGEAFLLTQHVVFGDVFRGYDFFFDR